jgi:hypothetical protein
LEGYPSGINSGNGKKITIWSWFLRNLMFFLLLYSQPLTCIYTGFSIATFDSRKGFLGAANEERHGDVKNLTFYFVSYVSFRFANNILRNRWLMRIRE